MIRNLENEWTDVHGPEGWFTGPEYVILNRDRTGFYVSDGSNASVALMTLEGQVEQVYNDSRLRNSKGLVLHHSGLLYVADNCSNTIFQLVPGSSKSEPMLDNSHELHYLIGIA